MSLLSRVVSSVVARGSRSLSTSTSLQFIAPQTRMRIVDNSAFSSIAPEQKKSAVSGAKKKYADVASNNGSTSTADDGTKDVKSLLQIGSAAAFKRQPMVIRVYNSRNRGGIGDKVLLAVAGTKRKAWVVGARLPSKNGWPRFESNNAVLVDDDGSPLGSRILVPIPAKLRSLQDSRKDITKILAIATSFV